MIVPAEMGVKRKFEELDGPVNSYVDQRQSILNISMCKLRTSSIKKVEPSLRRSVLIFNTLRHIEFELRQEGVALNPAAKTDMWSSLQADDSFTLDPPPGAELTHLRAESSVATEHTNPENLVAKSENVCDETRGEQMETADHHGSELAPTASSKARLPTTATDLLLNNEKLTISSFASLFETDKHSSPGSSLPLLNNGSSSPSLFLSSAFLSNAQGSTINNNHPDIFGDIDMSQYDFDLLSSFSPSMKLAPLSAEELMLTFPSEPLGTLATAATCKNEFLGDELDHIMQILVGI